MTKVTVVLADTATFDALDRGQLSIRVKRLEALTTVALVALDECPETEVVSPVIGVFVGHLERKST